MNTRANKLAAIMVVALAPTLSIVLPATADEPGNLSKARQAIVLVKPWVDDFDQLTVGRLLACAQKVSRPPANLKPTSRGFNLIIPVPVDGQTNEMTLSFLYPYVSELAFPLGNSVRIALLDTVYVNDRTVAHNYNDLEFDFRALIQAVKVILASCQ